jgi:hypothetical protein
MRFFLWTTRHFGDGITRRAPSPHPLEPGEFFLAGSISAVKPGLDSLLVMAGLVPGMTMMKEDEKTAHT